MDNPKPKALCAIEISANQASPFSENSKDFIEHLLRGNNQRLAKEQSREGLPEY